MKTTLFIIGFVCLGILLSFWAYLLFFGSPAGVSQIFVDLGLKNPTIERPIDIPETGINNNGSDSLAIGETLNQLTTKPVAGYSVASRPTDRIRYAERGTGHIFEINFTTNIETRLIGNTLAKTTEAYFSPDGLLAVLVQETETGTAATITTIPENTSVSAVTSKLPNNISEIKAISSTTVNYIEITDNQTIAYRFNRLSGSASELWRIPLTDIKVWWGTNRTFVVNKTAPNLKGAIYEVVGKDQLVPVTEQEYAYTALFNPTNTSVVTTHYDFEIKSLISEATSFGSESVSDIAILAIPEKCTFNPVEPNQLWCGAMLPSSQNANREFIKEWYTGTITSEDKLWRANLVNQSSDLVLNFLGETGLTIDLISPKFNQAGDKLFFINKINDALWLYNLPKVTTGNTLDTGTTSPAL